MKKLIIALSLLCMIGCTKMDSLFVNKKEKDMKEYKCILSESHIISEIHFDTIQVADMVPGTESGEIHLYTGTYHTEIIRKVNNSYSPEIIVDSYKISQLQIDSITYKGIYDTTCQSHIYLIGKLYDNSDYNYNH